MLIPKKVKHRKWQKGRSLKREVETRGTDLSYGSFGLQALESYWMTSAQIESARRTLTNFIKREGKIWIRIFPDKPITKKPPEVTMGAGKGAVDHYVVPVKPGRILFEMDGVSLAIAEKAFKLAGHKLPVKTRFIKK
ncbi:MAG: 50S ribosomal protein L16 [Candidatus Colwellbacteria bacterium]|nr:50S ribosomal protein L16 [Candidatus Colwellbacteria bacterium]